jgi:hypothetical protein
VYGEGDVESCALESRLERRKERLFRLVEDDGDAGDVGAVMVSCVISSPPRRQKWPVPQPGTGGARGVEPGCQSCTRREIYREDSLKR